MELTVGLVSGFIAAGIFVGKAIPSPITWRIIKLTHTQARQICPNALAYICSRQLGYRNSAATWTASSKVMEQSYWPFLLRTDGVHDKHVRPSVVWAGRLIPFMAILLSVASIVTPLGLYSATELGKPTMASFVYAPDPSIFGHYTMPRPPQDKVIRSCMTGLKPHGATENEADWLYLCPQEKLSDPGAPGTIPEVVRPSILSGTENHSTLCGPLDIQWRTYSGSPNLPSKLLGQMKSIQSLILTQDLDIVEGLVVDKVNKGVGFRNHTVPLGAGAEWQEDLLFLEPDTVCVDTNISTEWKGDSLGHFSVGNTLVNRGGLNNIDKTRPKPDVSDVFRNPDLVQRARATAWIHNVMYAYMFKVNQPPPRNQGIFETFTVNSNSSKPAPRILFTGQGTAFEDIRLASDFFVDLKDVRQQVFRKIQANQSDASVDMNLDADHLFDPEVLVEACLALNPHEFRSGRNMTAITPFVACGLLRGMPQVYSNNTVAQPYYSCATGVKAVIKTVKFAYKDDPVPLRGLKVVDIKDKQYLNQDDLPIWAVENATVGYALQSINPLWGLMSNNTQTASSIAALRQSHLYLPGIKASTVQNGGDLLAGIDIVAQALRSTYSLGDYFDIARPEFDQGALFDYHAFANLPLADKWQTLSASAKEASDIPNLIFQDTVVNAVTGSKGIGLFGTDNKHLVRPYVTVIKFNYAYVIPAALAATGTLMIIIMALASIFYKSENGLAVMKIHVQGLAPGRLFTTLLAPPGQEGSDLKTSSKSWNRQFGSWKVDLSNEYPVVVDTCQESKGANRSGGDGEQQRDDTDERDQRQDPLLGEHVDEG
ncbi:hypothetical protein CDD82_2596 [Ophiocordyceps australis]|uniref:Uncharacterized protein n=1 Tax=Ophiocordyceps australis TaxID=1399860 RepID=A0A2C5ZB56_9HYPO|nr:hypothetical protein CDD82_2596 [Ophiocordyceps australis]